MAVCYTRWAMTASPTKTPLHVRLRARRVALGWTQEVLARRAGTHQAAVAQIETDARRTPRIRAKLARALDLKVTVDELFDLPGGSP